MTGDRHRDVAGRQGTILLLMALTAIGQLGVNLALPALAEIGRDVAIARADSGLILSSYLVGLAGGQLFTGPLSDRFGRRPVLLSGLAAFAAAGAASALAGGATAFLLLRVMQGAAAAAPLAIGRAVARDLYDGPALLRATTLMTMAMAVVPGIAPALGGVLTQTVGWRGALAFAGVAGLALLTIAALRLPETNLAPVRGLRIGSVLRLYARLAVNAVFLRHSLANAMLLAALYGFLAGAPLVLIGALGLTPARFGLVPAATAAAYILGGWWLLRAGAVSKAGQRVVLAGRAAALAGPAVLILAAVLGQAGLGIIVAGAALYSLGLGILLPVGVAGALTPFRAEAGTASALLGALQMAAGALAGAAVGWIGGDPALAFPAVMLVCVALSLLAAPSARAT
jgi:DHA1 family bicyclomycin/chloramphenicol resistance-like MFS transporter